MKEKISNGIKYLNFSMWMVAGLLVFLSIGMLLLSLLRIQYRLMHLL